ncbi:MAG: hypothetical protein P1V97_11285 [Planctomycetota bacterium]|nr:hypothetical protein [Planctomycetota bacterium]
MTEIIERLNCEYIEPALAGLGFSKGSDHCFRKWSTDESSVCSIVQPCRYRHPTNCYTVELGFFSQFVHGHFGFPHMKYPETADCNASGVNFRLEKLLRFKITNGWAIESDHDFAEVGPFFRTNVEELFKPLIDELGTLSGWEKHFYEFLDDPDVTGRRGYNWSMYTYAILGQNSPNLVKAEQAIQSHESEPQKRRIEVHLDRQKAFIRALRS